jgi:hypothetical protein
MCPSWGFAILPRRRDGVGHTTAAQVCAPKSASSGVRLSRLRLRTPPIVEAQVSGDQYSRFRYAVVASEESSGADF